MANASVYRDLATAFHANAGASESVWALNVFNSTIDPVLAGAATIGLTSFDLTEDTLGTHATGARWSALYVVLLNNGFRAELMGNGIRVSWI